MLQAQGSSRPVAWPTVKDIAVRVFPGAAAMLSNRVLAALPQNEWDILRPHLSRVRLVPGQVVIERGHATEHVFFIEEGIASLMAEADAGGQGVQVAMIGREGIVGGLALLGAETGAFATVVMQVPGPALRIPVVTLRRCLDECPALHRFCLQYVQTLTRQIMQTAAYNARGTLAERCVRWLLMAHDRIEGDDVPVTHEALSAMLSVRRSGITMATAALQEEGLIRTSRGRIHVLDRAGLEAMLSGRARAAARARAADGAKDQPGLAASA